MAEEKNQQLDKPKDQAAADIEEGARIFTMPKQYREGKLGDMSKVKESKTPSKTTRKKPAKPSGPKMPQPPKHSAFLRILLVIGVIALIVLGGVAFYVYYNAQQPVDPEPEPQPEEPAPPQPDPEPEEPEPEPEEEPESPFPGPATPGTDTDSDGLTDLEENSIYQTDPRLPDSDKDGFLDGNEVFHRYNPNGDAPGTLLGSGLVQKMSARINGSEFTMLFPTVWRLDQADNVMVEPTNFEATTGETIVLRFEAKDPDVSIQDWFERQNINLEVISTTSKNDYPMLMTKTELAVFIDGGSFVARMQYDSGGKGLIDYLQTFQMMINSIEFSDVPEDEVEDESAQDTGDEDAETQPAENNTAQPE